MATNDNFTNAIPVYIDTAGGTYTSPSVSNVGFTVEAGEPGAGGRSAWWVYKPDASGSAVFDTQLTTSPGAASTDTLLYLFTGTALTALTEITYDDESGGANTSKITYTVTGATQYYIRVSTFNSSAPPDMNYVLRVVGPAASLPPVVVSAPPVDSFAVMRSGVEPDGLVTMVPLETTVRSTSGLWLIDNPPFGNEVQVRSGLEPLIIDMPPIGTEVGVDGVGRITVKVPSPGFAVQVSQPAPALIRVFRRLLDPTGDVVVPVRRPVFTVEVTQAEGTLLSSLTLDVQYDYTSSDFTGAPVLLSQDMPLLNGRNIVRLAATGDLPTGRVAWRARLRIGGEAMAWTGTQTFTVDTLAGDHTAQVTWSIVAGDADPHLWYITPAAASPGDLVTVVGQGFSDSRGRVTLAGTDMPVQRWTHIPALPQAYGPDRVIDPMTNRVDAEHDEVVVTVPDTVTAPGGQLAVIDGDGTVAADPPAPRPMFVPLRPFWLESSVSSDPPVTPPTPTGPANDIFDRAAPITISGSQQSTVTLSASNVGATVGADEPTLTSQYTATIPGYRSLWWVLPASAFTKPGVWYAEFNATASTVPVSLGFYVDRRAIDLGILESAHGPDGGTFSQSLITIQFNSVNTAGWVFYLRVASIQDVDATYNLTVITRSPA